MPSEIRLHVKQLLAKEQCVPLTKEQCHYLFGVMRLGLGDTVLLFNGRDGEWRSDIVRTGKRSGLLRLQEQTAPLVMPPDVWLLFAPIKKARTDFIVEKAVEMGGARIQPVQTEFTNSSRVQRDRLQAHAVEAAEQCGATYVPEVGDLDRRDRILADWDESRRILFCDEAKAGQRLALPDQRGPWAILIGPEGGFSERERERLLEHPFGHSISLGPRILRADTAAIAALTIWQQRLGDWV